MSLDSVHLDSYVLNREYSDHIPSQPEKITLRNKQVIYNVHPFARCVGRHCTIHNPSQHSLSGQPLLWRDDKGIFERLCEHGIGHDDHDDTVYRRSVANPAYISYIGIHGCDGCCANKYKEAQDGGGWIEGVEMEPVGPVKLVGIDDWESRIDNGTLRTFESGATRDTSEGKPEPWGFTSALVEKAFGEYMMKHQIQSDGQKRPSNNWTKGIPILEYTNSLSRHIQDLRLIWEGFDTEARTSDLIETLMAIRFNVDGIAYETLKENIV